MKKIFALFLSTALSLCLASMLQQELNQSV